MTIRNFVAIHARNDALITQWPLQSWQTVLPSEDRVSTVASDLPLSSRWENIDPVHFVLVASDPSTL